MKKYWIIALLCVAFQYIYGTDTYTINHRTKNIYHRFYVINRLEPTLRFIENKQNKKALNICYESLKNQSWKHPEIQTVCADIIDKKDISPLFTCWQHLYSYRHIEDNLFEAEFVQLIWLLCKVINISDSPCDKKNAQITTDTIANNFYLIHRLMRPIETLCSIYEQSPISISEQKKDMLHTSFFDEMKEPSHVRIQDCVREIEETNSMKPIKKVYKECVQYRYAGDDTFLQEQLSLLFFAYKLILTKKLSNQTEQVIMHEMDTIQYISNNLEEFSTDQILTAIDMMTDKLSTIHNLEKKGKSLLQKRVYWAALPLIAALSIYATYYYTQR